MSVDSKARVLSGTASKVDYLWSPSVYPCQLDIAESGPVRCGNRTFHLNGVQVRLGV